MKPDKKVDTIWYIIGWVLLGVGALYFVFVKLTGIHISDIMLPCMLNVWTGWYCPGCGGTRAVFSLARGEIVRSFIFHPIVIYTLIVGGCFLISQSIQRITRNKIRIAMHFRPIYIWLALIIVLGNFFIKNALLLFCNIALLG